MTNEVRDPLSDGELAIKLWELADDLEHRDGPPLKRQACKRLANELRQRAQDLARRAFEAKADHAET